MNNKEKFLKHVGQTSKNPISLEIVRAEGINIYTTDNKKYIDLASGVCVNNLGHNHPKIIEAIISQTKKYLHLMVYGEYIQEPQIQFAHKLKSLLPTTLNCLYYVNSGSEAIEGAIKLAKRYTQRTEIIAFKNAYHGSTHGALSIGHERFKNAFLPLLPDIKFLEFNNNKHICEISKKTACVVVEPIQAEAGVILPKNKFLKHLADQCRKNQALLILDEVQTGFGRTGTLFAFEQYDIVPDILVIAKAMGGGMPIGGFMSSRNILNCLTENPALGHITTFGGHPVSAASSLAALDVLVNTSILEKVYAKGNIFFNYLKNHSKISEIRKTGLLIAVELKKKKMAEKVVKALLDNGLVTDKFLFNENAVRIAPPLTITEEEIKKVSKIIIKVLDKI